MGMRYSNDFEPILLEDMTATLFGHDLPETGLNVKCLAVGALPEYYKDFGALSAAQWDSDNEDTNLEMNPWEIAQLRVRVLDDMQMRLKHSPATQQWRTKGTNFYLPQFPVDPEFDWLKVYLWKASEFFIWEDNTPRFDFYSPVALSNSRVLFSGWRFKLTKLAEGEKARVKIWISEWPSGKAF